MSDPVIRSGTPDESEVIRSVITEAFADPHVADLWADLQGGASLIAEEDGEVVGHVQLSRSWVDAPQRLVEVLVLSPLSVRPAWQRRGLGQQLVAAAIAQAFELGAPALFLEGSPDFYSRCGFTAALGHGFTRPSVRIPEAAFQVVLLPTWEPWMVGALVYAEAFWVHDAAGLR